MYTFHAHNISWHLFYIDAYSHAYLPPQTHTHTKHLSLANFARATLWARAHPTAHITLLLTPPQRILVEAQDICAKNGIHHITIQLEKQDVSSRCSVAQADVSTMISRRSTLTEPQWPGQPPTIPTIEEHQDEHYSK